MAAPVARDGGVQSVVRALELLEVLASSVDGLGVIDVAGESGLPQATVHRLLATLVGRGFVRQDPASRKYTLGSKLLRLGEAASRLFRSWARPYLAELVSISGETSNLALLEDGYVVYVAQVPSLHSMRMFTEVGRRLLPHATAVGKVLLAFGPREVTETIIARHGLPAHTPYTVTDPERFIMELDQVAIHGYALDEEEQEIGVCCVSVPVLGIPGAPAAMSVSGPAGRLDKATRQSLVPEMVRIAGEISRTVLDAS
ncbi:MAG: IclR family transcriptional regulator [Acidimicrobiia bacterium]